MVKMEKILSIVIPTYNMEKYLRKCLNSLIIDDAELFVLLEVLVVNDGSKDSSSEIAHEFENKYPEIFRAIDKDNGNYGSCVNVGLKEASGKYIKILDADDTFEKSNFKNFLSLLCRIDVDMVISDYTIVTESDATRRVCSYNLPHQTLFSYTKDLQDLKKLKMHAVTYKCDNLKRINYEQTEGVSYTDLEWIFFPITTVVNIYYFNQVIYKYLVGRDGQTVNLSIYYNRVQDRIKGAVTMINEIKNDFNEIYQDYLNHLLLGRLEGIYLSCLVVNRDDSLLDDFDNYIERHLPAEIYERLNLSNVNRLLKYRYIKRWRYTRKLPPIYITWCHMLIKKMQEVIS